MARNDILEGRKSWSGSGRLSPGQILEKHGSDRSGVRRYLRMSCLPSSEVASFTFSGVETCAKRGSVEPSGAATKLGVGSKKEVVPSFKGFSRATGDWGCHVDKTERDEVGVSELYFTSKDNFKVRTGMLWKEASVGIRQTWLRADDKNMLRTHPSLLHTFSNHRLLHVSGD